MSENSYKFSGTHLLENRGDHELSTLTYNAGAQDF